MSALSRKVSGWGVATGIVAIGIVALLFWQRDAIAAELPAAEPLSTGAPLDLGGDAILTAAPLRAGAAAIGKLGQSQQGLIVQPAPALNLSPPSSTINIRRPGTTQIGATAQLVQTSGAPIGITPSTAFPQFRVAGLQVTR